MSSIGFLWLECVRPLSNLQFLFDLRKKLHSSYLYQKEQKKQLCVLKLDKNFFAIQTLNTLPSDCQFCHHDVIVIYVQFTLDNNGARGDTDFVFFVMATLWNRADHYIFILFLLSFFFFFFVFSSPNLSGRRLDVYHTLAHGVALVQIQNAGLKCAAHGSLQIQDAKNRHLGTIAQLCRAIPSQLRHVSTIGKKLVNQQYLLHMS